MEQPNQPQGAAPASRGNVAFGWLTRIMAAAGILVPAIAAIFTGDMLVHGHPLYTVFLGTTMLISLAVLIFSLRRPLAAPKGLKGLRVVGAAAVALLLAGFCWLIPSSAVEPALTAMHSDSKVTVTETATDVVLTPAGGDGQTGVFFQPGALVDSRAYAAVLRPLAESGYTVVIPKQPLNIAFLAMTAFESAQMKHESISSWVVGGHSLGGVAAASDAQTFAFDAERPISGLLLFASYPSSDMSSTNMPVLSLSGSEDGLATPEKIQDSKPLLPADAKFLQIQGGTHAYFGDYGTQHGDGTATISHDEARSQISQASLDFVSSLQK
ncbi:alpha/beta hydrolase [Glutamicibacter sp.]|uniref:alpha/beta hydrolase n=1 Tax=Glutamicibacter sp. TaxID=1931995 RepID=UPI0028BDF427|nr:alpha/beta hydrolase [Glutamicibacter sp.]